MVKTVKTVKTVKGSVRPRPNAENVQYYNLTLELGTDPATGKRKRLYFKINTTDKQEAENELMIKKAEYLQEKIVEPSKETVGQFLERYLDTVRSTLSPATVRDYRGVIERYLEPEFGNMRLQDLTRTKVQQVYNAWKVKSNKSDNPLKATTIKHINRVFKSALNIAVEDGLIKENPTRRIKIGKDIEPNHLDVYTVEEIRELQKAVRGTDMELPVALLFDCVLRRGDDDDKIRLNQRKPSKYKGLRRFGPEKNLQRINKFMKERPIFYKNLIQMKENIRFYLRCFYCITKVMILQFNSENRTELARNG